MMKLALVLEHGYECRELITITVYVTHDGLVWQNFFSLIPSINVI